MDGALVCGAFLSALFQVGFDRLASRDFVNFLKGRKDINIDGSLEKLKKLLRSASVVLADAEEKQYTNPDVKGWLDELKHAVYVADDILDEIAYEALRCKVSGFIPTSVALFDTKIKSELETILKELELLIKEKDDLSLEKAAGGVRTRELTDFLPEEYGVFGRNADVEAIFQKFQPASVNDGICVVPIVGMGGIGKTTLARFIYNDNRIKEKFDHTVWVCVSEDFDSFRIVKTIFNVVPLATSNDQNMNLLQNEIKEKFMGKKIFIVLDDFWNEDYDDWLKLLKIFKFGAKEIKIIVTTRSEKVASNVCTVAAFLIKQLSDGECWSIFEKHAFITGKSGEFPILEEIGKQIVQKCKGLPLAAKALGSLLRCEQDPRKWTMILKSDIWDLLEGNNSILPALRLSYHYLPPHLKQCFAYCSIFPKDYEFTKYELVLLWMAQDFLQQSKGNGRMEEIGEQYFDALVSRSLFQRSSNKKSYFIMHDLVNDLATSISGEFCVRLEKNDESKEITEKARHFSYQNKGQFDNSKKFEFLYEAKGLRTFLSAGSYWWRGFDNVEMMMIDDLLEEFKTLRVLSLPSMRIKELPDSIDNLKHLRYLNIRNSEIKHLPDSLCNLYYLQTLILPQYITKLPTNMSKLINLRRLDNSGAKMEEMPPHMDKLKNLRKLPVFGVGKHDDGSSIKELGELQHLSGKLSLLNLENVQCINKDTTEVILKNKQDLSELKLEWKHGHGAEDSEKERILLEQLCPCTNLNSLTITNYEGTSFPKWLGDSSFSKMVSIELSDCANCFSLPPLGQLPDLKSLRIEYFGKIFSVGLEFYGNTINPFRALEYLSFKNMPEWQEWVLFKGEVFPCLRELYIKDCPKLIGGLPVQLPSLTKLDICECKQLVASLPNSPALHQLLLSYTGKIEGGVYSILPFPPFASLSRLEIRECPDLVSFPSGGLSALNLSEIVISMCENLKSLPEGMHTLQSLVHLDLGWCTELESFPEGGLPSSLESLAICRCEKLISRRMALGLQGLHSLRSFTISNHDEELESFPEEALLPPNLTDFTIGYLPNLKSLNGKGFQPLTSLKNLSIWSCHSLDCLLEDVLPTSLYQLQISCCCFLKERYGNEKGEGRVKIAHIPRISIS